MRRVAGRIAVACADRDGHRDRDRDPDARGRLPGRPHDALAAWTACAVLGAQEYLMQNPGTELRPYDGRRSDEEPRRLLPGDRRDDTSARHSRWRGQQYRDLRHRRHARLPEADQLRAEGRLAQTLGGGAQEGADLGGIAGQVGRQLRVRITGGILDPERRLSTRAVSAETRSRCVTTPRYLFSERVSDILAGAGPVLPTLPSRNRGHFKHSVPVGGPRTTRHRDDGGGQDPRCVSRRTVSWVPSG